MCVLKLYCVLCQAFRDLYCKRTMLISSSQLERIARMTNQVLLGGPCKIPIPQATGKCSDMKCSTCVVVWCFHVFLTQWPMIDQQIWSNHVKKESTSKAKTGLLWRAENQSWNRRLDCWGRSVLNLLVNTPYQRHKPESPISLNSLSWQILVKLCS